VTLRSRSGQHVHRPTSRASLHISMLASWILGCIVGSLSFRGMLWSRPQQLLQLPLDLSQSPLGIIAAAFWSRWLTKSGALRIAIVIPLTFSTAEIVAFSTPMELPQPAEFGLALVLMRASTCAA